MNTLLTFRMWASLQVQSQLSLVALVAAILIQGTSHSVAAIAGPATSDSHDLLVLRFDGNLIGESGEAPTQAQGYSFQTGVSDRGVLLPSPSKLFYASANNISALEGTFECWIKPQWNGNDGQGHMLLSWGGGGGILIGKDGANNMRIILNRFGAAPGGEVGVAFNVATWQANEWHHVAFTWSNTSKRLQAFSGGKLQAEQSFTINLPAITSTSLQIGGDGTGSYAQAVLDNLRISDIVRTPLEISNHMVEGLTIFTWTLDPPTSLVELWPTWYWWVSLGISADTNAGTLSLPALAASWTSTRPEVAVLESSTGRVHAFAPGTTLLTGSLGGTQNSFTVKVVKPVLAPVEEAVDPYLATATGDYLFKVPVVVLRYFPTTNGTTLDPALTGMNLSLAAMKTRAERIEKQHKFMLEEGSRFRGYANAMMPRALGYQVIKVITVYEDIPPGFPADAGNGTYFPDYNTILVRWGLDRLVNQLGAKEVWLWQYHFGRIVPNESNMSSPTTGDISNSYRTTGDQPIYARTYVTYGINLGREANEATHNHGHQLESILGHANFLQDGNNSLFWERFVGLNGARQWQMGRCGDTHHPPNADTDYDYYNPTPAWSDIEDWNPDHTGSQKLVSASTWGGIPYPWPDGVSPPGTTEAQWYIYWMQAMPGRGGSIPFGTNRMTNWWTFTGDWDLSIQAGLGLYETSSCAFGLSSTSQSFTPCGGTGSVDVTCGAGCKWIASSNEPWIIVTAGKFGAQSGTVSFTVKNDSGAARVGTIAIAGQMFTVNQGAGSPPGEVGPLTVTGNANTSIAWPTLAGAQLYDVSRGSLPGIGNGSYGGCMANDIAALSVLDTSMPAATTAYFYLVRGVHAVTCAAGTWGRDSAGRERVNLDTGACP